MFDSHCHLTDPRLLPQVEAVIQRANAAGVTRLVTVGTDPADHQRVLDLCERHRNVRCTIGIHPNEVSHFQIDAVDEMRCALNQPSVVAVGEIGLDYHYADNDLARQRRFFEAQLDLARSIQKPVVIHCRDAIDDGLEILKNFSTLRAVFHCFTGSLAEGRRVIEAGYYLGFTGVVTFNRSEELRQLTSETPDDRFLIETDAPYLTPQPMRKHKVNEPSFIIHTNAVMAAVRKVSAAELGATTTANANAFYGWPASV